MSYGKTLGIGSDKATGENFKDPAASKLAVLSTNEMRRVTPKKGKHYKEHRKLWGGYGYIHYLDCGNGFTNIIMS